jgi:hypothetical protein
MWARATVSHVESGLTSKQRWPREQALWIRKAASALPRASWEGNVETWRSRAFPLSERPSRKVPRRERNDASEGAVLHAPAQVRFGRKKPSYLAVNEADLSLAA